jgi:methylisocitrate lyase
LPDSCRAADSLSAGLLAPPAGARPKPAAALREILAQPGAVVVPGVFNALTARLAEQVGFRVVYATGAGIANSLLGLADVGLLTMKEMLDQVNYIVNAVGVPVIADVDTGYGNALNVYRTVREFEKAGVAAVQIEDQVMPKRCGHFAGKQVVPREEMIGKIKAALDARQDDLVIIARTDAREPLGLEEAIERAEAYAEAGADVTFVEAPRSREELELIGRRLARRAPQVVNLMEGGLTPLVELADLERMGFKIVLYANSVLRASLKAVQDILLHLRQRGSTTEVLHRLFTKEERDALTALPRVLELERRYADAAASTVRDHARRDQQGGILPGGGLAGRP